MSQPHEMLARFRYIAYFRRITSYVIATALHKRHVSIFLFVRKTEDHPEFLQVLHRDWGCYLFPAAEINPDHGGADWVAQRCGEKVGLNGSSEVAFGDLILHRLETLDFVKIKRSGSDLKRRAYFYKFYLVRLRDPKKWSAFEVSIPTPLSARWMTCNQLLNDRITYAKNSDIIDHLTVEISKGHALPASAS